jgi:hypothetical protein
VQFDGNVAVSLVGIGAVKTKDRKGRGMAGKRLGASTRERKLLHGKMAIDEPQSTSVRVIKKGEGVQMQVPDSQQASEGPPAHSPDSHHFPVSEH